MQAEVATEEEVFKFIEKALEMDSFDERLVIVNPEEEEEVKKKLKGWKRWKKEGKLKIAETPRFKLEKPPVLEAE